MATENAGNLNNIDYQMLAIFDDPVALSQMENILLNAEFYGLELPNTDEIQTSPTVEDYKEVENDNEHQNEVYIAPKQNKQKHVFAVPKIYNCLYCEKRFYNKKAIRKHQLKHAEEQLRCTRCGLRTHNIEILRRHTIYFHCIRYKHSTVGTPPI